MYLKSIEVQGFKSFANKITFQFHPGITGIVGPNGSGKSNVADAVRWVLGEQSAKQLRGANMQDVIFSGTENRKPLGFASVAITLDNGDGKLPTDYREVTVTRRVYRSGESEYLINGRACRLKDINELFYDTGIGKEGYSIIGQGQIDKILSGKPEERRELFDEAAGIVKFKRRKAAAQKKLDDEHGNLVRVNDILSELTKQLGPMERQAETAKIYLKKREELKTLDVNLFLLELGDFREKLADVEQKLDIAQNDLKETQAGYASAKEDYERTESAAEELSGRIEEARERERESQLCIRQAEGQIQLLKERIHTASVSEEHLRARLAAICQELKTRGAAEAEGLKELQTLRAETAKAQEEQADAQLEADATAASISHIERQIEQSKSELITLLNARGSTKMRMERYDTMLEQAQIRKAELSQKILEMKSRENEQAVSAAALRKDYEEICGKIEQLGGEAAACEKEAEKFRQEMILCSQKIESGQSAYHREASRLESLRNITERYDGYGNSIRRVMEQKGSEPGLLGVVADLVKTEKAYETAIETALGGSIQNIVTEDENTAKRMIDFLKRNKYGRATFLPLTSITARGGIDEKALREPGVIGTASTLVRADKKYDGLVRYLLGKVLVADHIDHAIAIARKYHYSLRIVTLEGESLSPGGSMTGGAFKNSSNLLGRRREIEELTAAVARLQKELARDKEALEESRGKRNAYRDRIVAINESLQKEYIRQNTAKLELAQLEQREKEMQTGYAGLRKESGDIDLQVRDLNEEKARIQEELEESAGREREINAFVAERQKELETEKNGAQLLSAAAEEIRLRASGARQKEEFLVQDLARIREEKKSLEAEREQTLAGIDAGNREAEEQKRAIEELAGKNEGEQKRVEETAAEIAALTAQRDEKTRINKSFFARREELSERMGNLDKECFRLEAQREKLEEGKEARISGIWEAYELTPNTAAELRQEDCGTPAEMRKGISALKNEMKALGNVNVNAIEDFKELSERHTFLQTQHDDLVTAEEALEKIIGELDAGMRKQFAEKFAQIQKEFDRVFKELFGGGAGSLELVEEEDILEAGIRIVSQPPGKKLQNMMQLSGGEKALTAIALLFAIQNLKPSPFCLLDEIEAALDESNVTRYAGYLHKLTKNTQFIIITHRRGTMNVADRLYGITMQEKGVSALVSVNLIEGDLDA